METVDSVIKMKQQVQADTRDWRGRSRISLPFVEETDPESQFILMDPIRLQIEYVQVRSFIIQKCINEVAQSLSQNRESVQ